MTREERAEEIEFLLLVGKPMAEIAKRHGISEAYCRSEFAALRRHRRVTDPRRMREENGDRLIELNWYADMLHRHGPSPTSWGT